MRLTKQRVIAEVARLTMGGVFLIWGANGFFSFLPLPAPESGGARFMEALKDTGYLYWVIKSIECLCGTLLITNLFAPLCLMILAPIIFNIFFYGVFLDTNFLTIFMPLLLSACEIYLVWYYQDLFKWFFKYQVYTDPVRDQKAHFVLVEELKERHPEIYELIKREGLVGDSQEISRTLQRKKSA